MDVDSLIKNKVIGGVCSGLANYFDIDVSLVRVLFAIMFLCASAGFWLYIILWIVMPAGNGFQPTAETIDAVMNDASPNPQINKGSLVVGLILIGLGAFGLIHRFVPAFNWQMVWPIILIVLGLV